MDSISRNSSQDSFCCLTFEHTLKLWYGVQMLSPLVGVSTAQLQHQQTSWAGNV